MKVLLLGTAYPFRGGLASYNERLALEFQNQGHDVEIITFTTQYPNFLFPGKTQFSKESKPESINITRKLNSVNPFNWFKVGNSIKKAKPDLVIVKYWLPFMSPSFSTVLKTIRKNKHTKIISIIDNIIPHEKRIGDDFFNRMFVRNIDGFICMSDNVKSDLETYVSDKPVVLTPHPLFDNFGNAVSKDTAKEKLNLDPNTNYLLFFGFVREYKGLDWLLEAFSKSEIRKQGKKLLIAGEFYQSNEKYIEIIKENNLEDEVILHQKFITDSDVKYYFGASDVVVQPYKTATQSGVTQIAYHFNKPMIVTNVGGLSEIIPNNKVGYVVEPNVEGVQKALDDFYNQNKEQDFITGVKEEKEKFTWTVLTEKIEQLYHEV